MHFEGGVSGALGDGPALIRAERDNDLQWVPHTESERERNREIALSGVSEQSGETDSLKETGRERQIDTARDTEREKYSE